MNNGIDKTRYMFHRGRLSAMSHSVSSHWLRLSPKPQHGNLRQPKWQSPVVSDFINYYYVFVLLPLAFFQLTSSDNNTFRDSLRLFIRNKCHNHPNRWRFRVQPSHRLHVNLDTLEQCSKNTCDHLHIFSAPIDYSSKHDISKLMRINFEIKQNNFQGYLILITLQLILIWNGNYVFTS